MKFIILTVALLCFIHTEAQPVNQEHIDKYGKCAQYTEENGVITGCSSCYEGHKKSGDKCVFDTETVKYPGYDCQADGTCKFYDIRYDGKTTCTYNVKLVDANGKEISGSQATCLACAKFTSDGVCEECASGYLLNGDKCVPVDTIKPFGDDVTNDNCIQGIYESGSPKCQTCSGSYAITSDFKCALVTNPNIEGCVEKQVMFDGNKYTSKCTACRPGYVLKDNTCVKSRDNCEVSATGETCQKCMKGYYLSQDKSECKECELIQPPENFAEDECNVLSQESCEQCNPNCESNSELMMCVSKHCDLFDSSNKCVRCQQGYSLSNGKCVKCTNNCQISGNQQCEVGYYYDKIKGCVKCSGKCTDCYSDSVCKEGNSLLGNKHALNGLPCFDPNCELCSSDNQHVCLKCSSSTELIKGRCYKKAIQNYLVNTAQAFTACYHTEALNLKTGESLETMQEKLNAGFSRQVSIGFEHASNKVVTADEEYYLCEYHDLLPYYFYENEGSIKCVGNNRDPYNDCECFENYYAKDVNKFSDCVKFKDPHCVEPLTENICGKCRQGLTLKNNGTLDEPGYECGCPNGQRPDVDGKCIPCTKECATCRTDSEGKEQCLTCKGRAQSNQNVYKENNYYRDPNKLCQCLDGYLAYEEDPNVVYACNPKPAGCRKPEASMYVVHCNSCEKEGFSTVSGCTDCENGYRKENNECKKCPKFGTYEFSACTSCDANQCTVCNDENMDPQTNCQTCKTGYSLKFRSVGETGGQIVGQTAEPFCVPCHDYCSSEGGNGCYYATKENCQKSSAEADDSTDEAEEEGTYNNPYDTAKIEAETYSVFCDDCKEDYANPCLQCKCSDDSLRVSGECKPCSNLVDKAYHNLCDLSKGCQQSDTQPPYYACIECKSDYNKRSVSSNCTKCSDPTYYPVEAKNGNGGCEKCPNICRTCTDADHCEICADEKKEGAKCDQCKAGYFKKGDNCEKCDDGCKLCSGDKFSCSACTGENRVPSTDNGCSQCDSGHYFDPLDKDCKTITPNHGYLETVLVCELNDGKLVDCRDLIDKNTREIKDEYKVKFTTQTSKRFERAVKCDTKILGVALEPVDGKCVCKTGFIDDRDPADIEASPEPKCKDVRGLTGDDFCIDAVMNKTEGTFKCLKCNADYLDHSTGVCKCKDGRYTTSWGACIPCDRHMKGCTKCEKCKGDERGDDCVDKKPVCLECASGYSLKDGACHAN